MKEFILRSRTGRTTLTTSEMKKILLAHDTGAAAAAAAAVDAADTPHCCLSIYVITLSLRSVLASSARVVTIGRIRHRLKVNTILTHRLLTRVHCMQ